MKESINKTKQLARTLQRSGRNQQKGFVDNRQNSVKQTKLIRAIQKKGVNVVQRVVHWTVGPDVVYDPRKQFEDKDNCHTYACIMERKKKGDYIKSDGYNSCIGISIYRPALGDKPSKGLLAHFAGGGKDKKDRIDKFVKDYNELISKWESLETKDIVTIWQGKGSKNEQSLERFNYLLEKFASLPNYVFKHPHISGTAYLHLDNGDVNESPSPYESLLERFENNNLSSKYKLEKMQALHMDIPKITFAK